MRIQINEEHAYTESEYAKHLSWVDWNELFHCELDNTYIDSTLLDKLIVDGHLNALRFMWTFCDKLTLALNKHYTFRKAVQKGQLDIVKFLMEITPEHERIPMLNPDNSEAVFGTAIHDAITLQQPDVLAFFLEIPGVQRLFLYDNSFTGYGIDFAIRQKRFDLLEQIIRLTPTHVLDKALTWSANWAFETSVSQGDLELSTLILKHIPHEFHNRMISHNKFKGLHNALENNHYNVVHSLLLYPLVFNFVTSDDWAGNKLFCQLAIENKPGLMQAMYQQADPEIRHNWVSYEVLSLAAEQGHMDVVDYLLSITEDDTRNGLFSNDNYAAINAVIRLAHKNGHFKLIQHLISCFPPAFEFALYNTQYDDLTAPILQTHLECLRSGGTLPMPLAIILLKLCVINNRTENLGDLRLLLNTPNIGENISNSTNVASTLLRRACLHGGMEILEALLTVPSIQNHIPDVLLSFEFQYETNTNINIGYFTNINIGYLFAISQKAIGQVGPFAYLLPAFFEEAFQTWQTNRQGNVQNDIHVNINWEKRENSMSTGGSKEQIASAASQDFPQINYQIQYDAFIEYIAQRLQTLEGHRHALTRPENRRTFMPEKQSSGPTRDALGDIMSSTAQQIAGLHTALRLLLRDPYNSTYGSYSACDIDYTFICMVGILYTYATETDSRDALVWDMVSIRRGHNSDKDSQGNYFPRASSGEDWITCNEGYIGRIWQSFAYNKNLIRERMAGKILHPFNEIELRTDVQSVVREQLRQTIPQLPSTDAMQHLANLVYFALFAPGNYLFVDEEFIAAQDQAKQAIEWVSKQIDISAASQLPQQTIAPSVSEIIIDEQIRVIANNIMTETIGFLTDPGEQRIDDTNHQYDRMREILLEHVLPALLEQSLIEPGSGLSHRDLDRIATAFKEGLSTEQRNTIQNLLADGVVRRVMTQGVKNLSAKQYEYIQQLLSLGFFDQTCLTHALYKASQSVRSPLNVRAWIELELQRFSQVLGFSLPTENLFDEANILINQNANAVITNSVLPIQRFQTRLWQRLGPFQNLERMARQGIAPASLKLAELYLANKVPDLNMGNKNTARDKADWYSLIAAKQALLCDSQDVYKSIMSWRATNRFVWSSLQEAMTEATPAQTLFVEQHLRFATTKPDSILLQPDLCDSKEDDSDHRISLVASSSESVTADHLSNQLKRAVQNAFENYQTWHTTHAEFEKVKRGKKPGLFSWFRHGQLGLDNARGFNHLVQGVVPAENPDTQIINLIISLLNDKGVRLHRHSFATYVVDSVLEITGVEVPMNAHNGYSRSAALNAILALTSSLEDSPDYHSTRP